MKKNRSLRQGVSYVRKTTATAIMATSDTFIPLHMKRMLCIFIREVATDDQILSVSQKGNEFLFDALVANYEVIATIYQARFGEDPV